MPWIFAGLQAAITLCWVIYNFYVPGLLEAMGLGADLALGIQLVENALAAVVEPVMGGMSDWTRYHWGSRFPVIGAGIFGAAGLFALIPGGKGQGVLVGLLVMWAIAMSVFRSPAMALLGQAVASQERTQTVAALTFGAGLVGGLAPLSHEWMVAQGPGVTFGMGSVVLVVAGLALRWVTPPSPPQDGGALPWDWPRLGILMGLGLTVATTFRMMLIQAPMFLAPDWTPAAVIALILLISGGVALPCGRWGQQLGSKRLLQMGLLLLSLGLGGSRLVPGLLWVVIFGIGWSLMATGAISYALAQVPVNQAGLALGMYFGGFAGAMAVINTIVAIWGSLPSPGMVGMAAAFLGIVVISPLPPPSRA